ncbi:MAG: ATP-binding cassette domain-containing protein, partial [Rhizobiales bacterium]|nr:ATP-binding cassette domain-containing protein [Hyphomicrobiales bacterium]
MISINNLSLRRGPRLLLAGATGLINRGERVGVVGDNGCGKSSLFAMILGELTADEGSLTVQDDTVIGHVSQQTPSSGQSAIDYVLDGDQALRETERALAQIDHEHDGATAARWYERMEQIDGYSAPARAAQLMHGLGFGQAQLEAATRSFSGGWRVRLNLAQALMCPSDLLLLDEPTNHLDLDAVVWLEEWLSAYQGTLLMISHDRDFLDAVCRRILHIENATLRSYAGNYSRFEITRAELLASEQAASAKQQRAISHMEDYVRRFRAKATKARQAQSRLKALERMQIIAPAHLRSPFSFQFYQPAQASDPLLLLDNVSCGYGDNTVLERISVSIRSTDRLALVGHNGAGKSTFVKLLAGELSPMSGDMITAKNLNIGYFAQHQLEQLDAHATPLQHFEIAYPDVRHQEFRNYLGGFGFPNERIEEKIAPFSGGEKARLALALLI